MDNNDELVGLGIELAVLTIIITIAVWVGDGWNSAWQAFLVTASIFTGTWLACYAFGE